MERTTPRAVLLIGELAQIAERFEVEWRLGQGEDREWPLVELCERSQLGNRWLCLTGFPGGDPLDGDSGTLRRQVQRRADALARPLEDGGGYGCEIGGTGASSGVVRSQGAQAGAATEPDGSPADVGTPLRRIT